MAATGGHALVTGTSSGIGAAIAHRLLNDGWQVTGVARRASDIASPRFRSLQCDLADEASRTAMLDQVGDVTAVVHAAGLLSTGFLGTLDAQKLGGMWAVHVAAAEQIANTLAPRLPAGGRIVLIGSRTWTGSAGRSQYAATKAAMVAMARSWAIELADKGVTVNVVAPAATETPMLTDPARSNVSPRLPPIGRLIRPEEVAGAVAYLLSRDADAVTGQVLTICGGSSL